MSKILTEITPLSDKDCFYLIDRRKDCFDYPIHRHEEFEINYVSNCEGCVRVAGDSIETLGYHDLVLVGPGLEHGWNQGNAGPKGDMREITIQFPASLISEELMMKNQMSTIRDLFGRARSGVAFGDGFINGVLRRLDELTMPQPGFTRFLRLLSIIYEMSVTDDSRILSTTSFANVSLTSDSRRILKVEEYIAQHFAEPLRLEELASLAGMAPTAFSRFFKTRTGRTLSDYIIDIRIGHAARRLVDTTMTSAEICYDCGFNNISNFNRLFRKKKKCSPMQFRQNYLKTKIII